MRDQDFKKQRFDLNSGQDFVSNLPRSLKHNILSRLNILEAVRTCILSKRWRYAWRTMPKLVICRDYFNEIGKDRDIDCINFINLLLSHHKGRITRFILSIENFNYEDLDRWIHVLGNKGVKYLSINFDLMDSCEIPPSFLSHLHGLRKLKFRSRILDVPQLFRGFKLLRTLDLEVATIDGTDFERLVSRCPLLQDLRFVNKFGSFDNLVIQSQSLIEITVLANFKHLVFETPKLLMLCVALTNSRLDHKLFEAVRGSYQTHPAGLLQYHVFSVFCEACHIKATPGKFPIKFNHLINMAVDINVSNEDSLVAALCLLKSAPKLEVLHLKLSNRGDLGSYSNFNSFWESEASDALFSNLKTIIIQPNVSLFTIAIVKFVLRTAPMLEEMTIADLGISIMMHAMRSPRMLQHLSQINQDVNFMEASMETVLEVLKLPRLSKKATVLFDMPDISGCMEQSATPVSSCPLD